MGQANNRGTHEERRAEALERNLESAEVVMFMSVQDGKLNVGFLPKDKEPDQDSPAVILASYLSANLGEIAGQAMAMYEAYKDSQNPQIVTDATPRLAGPDGSPLPRVTH